MFGFSKYLIAFLRLLFDTVILYLKPGTLSLTINSIYFDLNLIELQIYHLC